MVFIIEGQMAQLRHNPTEIFRANKDGQVSLAAINAGVPLSRYLEELDPSSRYADEPGGARLDAFGRQLREAGITTVTDPARAVYADKIEKFSEVGARGLLLEWCFRRYREARFGRPANPGSGGVIRQFPNGRSVYMSADEGIGTVWRPYFDAAQERYSQIEAPISLAQIIAVETPVEGDTYRAAYITDPAAADLRKYRVGETAEIPIAKISGAQHEVRAYKYGRGFEMSYEQMRRQRIDKVAFWIMRAAIQEETDKVEHALDVAVNGDGNANAATAYNLTTLDSAASAGTLSVRGWLAFKTKFMNAYNMDVAFAREADFLDIQTLQMPNANWFASTVPGIGSFRNINRNVDTTVGIGLTSSVPVDKIVGIDTRFALEHFFEIGASITETERFIRNQTELVVMSEVEGFSVLDKMATRVLNVNA